MIGQSLSCVDFLPTILTLMGVRSNFQVEGRDASPLFRGSTPADWSDVTFLRGTPGNPWLCAVTDRYKLVLAPRERPWLIDLQLDPNELTNRCAEPAYRSLVQGLTRQLIAYCEESRDPYGRTPGINTAIRSLLPSE